MMSEGDDPYEGDIDDEMFTHRERPTQDRWQRPKVVSEFVRRAIEGTVGSMEKSSNLSREALSFLLQQGDRGKKELVRIVAHEVNDFLKNVDLSSEVIKVLTNLSIEVNATVRFKTKDGVLTPEITTHKAEVTPSPAIDSTPPTEVPVEDKDKPPQ